MSKSLKLAGLATASLIALTAAAQAGGFAIREQSAEGLGAAFAGAAAGTGGLSSMYWNPATLAKTRGVQFTVIGSGILPYAKVTPTSTTNAIVSGAGGTAADSSDLALDAFVPAGYASWQFGDKMWLGLGVNAPFGLASKAPFNWSGQVFNRTSKIKTYNANPSIAYELNDWLSIGVGLQIQQIKVSMNNATALTTNANTVELKGDDTSTGFTAGILLKPWQGGELGVGYRSRMSPKLNGDQIVTLTASNSIFSDDPIKSNIRLPDTVSIGLRQQLTSNFTLLVGGEWTHWSVWSQFPVYKKVDNSLSTTLVFNYKNAWMTSVGGEYAWDKNLTLRGGLAYEKAPVQNDNRTNRVPDADRTWLAVGASYKIDDRISLDASYAHLIVRNGTISQTNSAGTFTFNGDMKAHTDLVSVGLNFKLGAEPKKTTKAMITK